MSMSILIAVVMIAIFVLAVVAAVIGLVLVAVHRHRDHRTAQQRWEDEHGDEDTTSAKTPPGPQNMWFGTGR